MCSRRSRYLYLLGRGGGVVYEKGDGVSRGVFGGRGVGVVKIDVFL